MSSRFSRMMIALALIASVWVTPIAVIAQTTQPQSQQPTQSSSNQDEPPPMPAPSPTPSNSRQQQTSGQRSSSQSNRTQTAATPAPTRNNNRPLSSNEDPSQIGRRRINSGIIASMSMSQEREMAMGRQLAMEIERQARLIDDPIITEYVNRIGQNIVLHSDARIPFTIKVIDSDEVNAFALPGGFFYVNRGLILAASNESELAGVMAHEIAHVAARHAAESMARAQLAQYGLLAGMILGVPPILAQVASLGIGAGFMKYTRNAEQEADRLGVQYLYAAGYDPNGLATMFEKLETLNRRRPGFIARLFASHPQPANRLADSRSLIARFPEREEYVVSSSEFQRVRARLLRMSNARASSVGDVAPSADGTPGRPTLRRRQPASDDPNAPQQTDPGDTTTTPQSNAPPPPVLRRQPSAQPSPSPTPSSGTPQ